jgi:hypothetical protein
MKKILLLLFSLFILSCSSDDSSDPVIDSDVSTGDYFPLSNNNYWVYDVQGTMPSAVSDSIYISGDINFNGNTYKQFKMDEMPFGFLSSAINNNGVRKLGDRLLLSGSAMISFIQDFPMSIQLQDFTILNESAANGQVIGTTSGTVFHTRMVITRLILIIRLLLLQWETLPHTQLPMVKYTQM